MLSYPSLTVKPYIGKIELKPKTEIEHAELKINRRFDDFQDLKEMRQSVDLIANSVHKYIERQRSEYESFVLAELYNRGYDLLRLEKSDCSRRKQPLFGNSELEQFFVDGVLVFSVKKTTCFEGSDGKYMIYTDYEVED